MKTAEEIPRIVAKACVGECDHIPHGACQKCVEKALTDFAEARVKEETDKLKTHWFGLVETSWGEGIRNEALEDAAKMLEKDCSDYGLLREWSM